MQEQAFDIRSILAAGRRRLGIGSAVALWTAAAATAVTLALPNLYRASVMVRVEPASNPLEISGYVNPAEEAARVSTRLDKIQQTVLSQPSLQRLVTDLDLWPELRNHGMIEVAADRLASAVAVEQDQPAGSSIAPRSLSISYDASDPGSAARVANALAVAWIQANNELQRQSMTPSTAFLKAQLDSVKNRLTAQNQRIGSFNRQHSGELPQQEQANLAVLGRLNGQLQANLTNQQQLRQQQLQLQTALASGTAGPDPAHSPAAQLADLQQQLRQLQTRFTDQYPDVIRLKQEIATLQATMPAHTGVQDTSAPANVDGSTLDFGGDRHMLTQINGQLKDLQQKEASLRSEISEYEARLQQAPERGQQLAQLSRDYTTTTDLYDSLLKQYEQAQLSSLRQAHDVSETLEVAAPAQPPAEPVAPNRQLMLAAGVVLGIVLGIVAMFIAERVDSSFHSVDDLKAFTAVPIMATIPRIMTRRDVWRRRGRVFLQAVGVLAVLVLVAGVTYHFAYNSEPIVRLLAKAHV
jgi:polysaccharide chain length determinant protein (PEP-CTERM system associated)